MTKNQLKIIIRSIVNESLKVLSERVDNGEWWIYPGGDTQFADINIGENGHQGYVTWHLCHEILEFFDINVDEPGLLTDYFDEIKKELIEKDELTPEELQQWEDDPYAMIIKKMIDGGLYTDRKQATIAFMIACGSNTGMDPREYGMKFLKWKLVKVQGNKVYIQTYTLTPDDLKDISRGIYDIEREDFDEEPENEEESTTVYIEVFSNNNVYRDIPLEVIHKKNITALNDYRVRSSLMNESFHEGKEWTIHEGFEKITAIFEDNSKLSFDIHFRDNMGEDKQKWKKKAVSKWKSLAREIYKDCDQLNEVGNRVFKPWKECFKEALNMKEMKEFVKVDFNPIFN